MSHEATNWAVKQRGIDATAKIILWNLADSHNKHTKRCDPSQKRLAHDCEISRATLNRHLQKLEAINIIKRVQRRDERTFKQLSTFYILGLDFDEPQGVDEPVSQNETRDLAKAVSQNQPVPCLKSDDSRVSQLCDTNQEYKPGKEPKARTQSRAHEREAGHEPPTSDPIPDVHDQFEESIWPHHWRAGDNAAKAFTEFEKLSVEERVECVRVMEVAKATICRDQPNPDYRVGLAKWINEKRFKGLVDAAVALEEDKQKIAGAVTLDRFADAKMFKACERVLGKDVSPALNRYMFIKPIIDKARASL